MKDLRNMLCSKCRKNPAEVFMTSIVNNKKIEEILCLECALKKEEVSQMLKQDSQFQQFVDQALQIRKQVAPREVAKIETQTKEYKLEVMEDCPVCGTGLEKVLESASVGCGHCYQIFAADIEKMLPENIFANYMGKIPKRSRAEDNIERKLLILEKKLEESIKKEEYEKAGILKAEIKSLQQAQQ